MMSAVLLAMGTYAVFVFDRFGMQVMTAPRGAVRMLLIGFYGWLWLAGAAWVIARFRTGRAQSFAVGFRVAGYAHLPLMLVAIAIQIFSI